MEQLVERYTQIPPAQRYLLAALIIGGLVAGYYYSVYTGQEDKLGALREKLGRQQTAAAAKRSIAENEEIYKAKIAKLQEQLDQARAQLPDDADVPQLLSQLGDKERQTGLTITDFQPLKEKKQDFYAEIAFDVKASGTYHEVAKFIDHLSKLDRIIDVFSLQMTNPKSEASKVVVESRFTVKTYRFLSKSDGAGKKGKP